MKLPLNAEWTKHISTKSLLSQGIPVVMPNEEFWDSCAKNKTIILFKLLAKNEQWAVYQEFPTTLTQQRQINSAGGARDNIGKWIQHVWHFDSKQSFLKYKISNITKGSEWGEWFSTCGFSYDSIQYERYIDERNDLPCVWIRPAS